MHLCQKTFLGTHEHNGELLEQLQVLPSVVVGSFGQREEVAAVVLLKCMLSRAFDSDVSFSVAAF